CGNEAVSEVGQSRYHSQTPGSLRATPRLRVHGALRSIENCQAQAPFGGPERVGLHKGVDADRGRSEQSNRNQTEGQMDHRIVRILGAFVVAIAVALVVIPVAAQSGKADAKARAEAWTPPRGADGHVDLSGVWSHNAATPFERPKELEGRELLTDQEVENLKRNAAELFNG